MAIQAQQTLSQFASDPQPTFTSKSNPWFYAHIGQEHHGREPDGSLTELEPAFRDLLACRTSELVLDDVAARRRTVDAFYAGLAGDDERRD